MVAEWRGVAVIRPGMEFKGWVEIAGRHCTLDRIRWIIAHADSLDGGEGITLVVFEHDKCWGRRVPLEIGAMAEKAQTGGVVPDLILVRPYFADVGAEQHSRDCELSRKNDRRPASVGDCDLHREINYVSLGAVFTEFCRDKELGGHLDPGKFRRCRGLWRAVALRILALRQHQHK